MFSSSLRHMQLPAELDAEHCGPSSARSAWMCCAGLARGKKAASQQREVTRHRSAAHSEQNV